MKVKIWPLNCSLKFHIRAYAGWESHCEITQRGINLKKCSSTNNLAIFKQDIWKIHKQTSHYDYCFYSYVNLHIRISAFLIFSSKLFALSPQRMTWIRRQNAIAGVKHITVHQFNKIIALEHIIAHIFMHKLCSITLRYNWRH